ncbi:MAG: hypothetical protein PVSMB4_03000 [Ktedonobacterales bacterium]
MLSRMLQASDDQRAISAGGCGSRSHVRAWGGGCAWGVLRWHSTTPQASVPQERAAGHGSVLRLPGQVLPFPHAHAPGATQSRRVAAGSVAKPRALATGAQRGDQLCRRSRAAADMVWLAIERTTAPTGTRRHMPPGNARAVSARATTCAMCQ